MQQFTSKTFVRSKDAAEIRIWKCMFKFFPLLPLFGTVITLFFLITEKESKVLYLLGICSNVKPNLHFYLTVIFLFFKLKVECVYFQKVGNFIPAQNDYLARTWLSFSLDITQCVMQRQVQNSHIDIVGRAAMTHSVTKMTV